MNEIITDRSFIPVLNIIIPCYNEEQVLPVTAPIFLAQLNEMIAAKLVSSDSRIVFVDDGSHDKTWEIITALSAENEAFYGLRQSRNRGHQNALLAGLTERMNSCDITITVDCDGQDDPSAMTEMVKEYLNGNEIVYGVRTSRKKDGFFKRKTANGFYRFLQRMGAELIDNHADYRLLSAKVIRHLADYGEVNLFLRGIVPTIGFQSSCVGYERQERMAGKTHYPLSKMTKLATDGITGFSTKPLHIIAWVGIVLFLLNFIGIIIATALFLGGKAVAGWIFAVLILCLFGSIQLICLGVVAIYIGNIQTEVKHRPRYIICDKTVEK